MTGKTRDYLADLALQKGVNLGRVEDREQSYASRRIDELKAMPDATFTIPDGAAIDKVLKRIANINAELQKWTLTE